jgi:hypothetical protein
MEFVFEYETGLQEYTFWLTKLLLYLSLCGLVGTRALLTWKLLSGARDNEPRKSSQNTEDRDQN